MTRKRNDSHSTEFGLWLREQAEIESRLGFVATNIDFVWSNYKTGQWMLLEEKRFNKRPTYCQRKLFEQLDCAVGDDPTYCGFHMIIFEKTSPTDGKIWIDGNEVDRHRLIQFLLFADPLAVQNKKGSR